MALFPKSVSQDRIGGFQLFWDLILTRVGGPLPNGLFMAYKWG